MGQKNGEILQRVIPGALALERQRCKEDRPFFDESLDSDSGSMIVRLLNPLSLWKAVKSERRDRLCRLLRNALLVITTRCEGPWNLPW